MQQRLAVIAFNLGGPDRPESVQPFLFNLFNDPAIIGLPNPFRWMLARLISGRRAPTAREIYAKIGGGSPLLEQTRAQARALERALSGDYVAKVWPCMRYWHPFSDEVVREVTAFRPDKIVLLPLYPQFSTTTTASSVQDWKRAAARAGLGQAQTAVCCYPTEAGFVTAMARATAAGIREAEGRGDVRVLFSAHGLPKRIVERGDPYPAQVAASAAAIVAELKRPRLDWLVCYQSRVGPLEWIGPATDVEIERAAREGKAIVVVPLAFVSEHSETLVELDIEYGHLAERSGAAAYVRVATVQADPTFIAGLAGLVGAAAAGTGEGWMRGTGFSCGHAASQCPLTPSVGVKN